MRQALRTSTVHLRAIVAAALALAFVLALATLAWAAPALSIDSGPSGSTNDTTPAFGFTADPSATTIECSIDQGTPAFGPCSGAASHAPDAPLPDGEYVFRVRAGDGAEETVETRSFSVDTAAPSLSIDSGPSGPTDDTTPSFGFTAESGASVECSVDDGTPAYGPCSGAASHTAATLADGSYVFRVRATDAAGNEAVATRSFSVDTAAPSLSIDSGPTGLTDDRTPSFGFTAEPGATVECSVDQGTPAYGSCTTATSHTATALADGSYVFRVRATDGAGNQASASQSFSIDTAAPSLSIDSGSTGPTDDRTPSFGFTAEAGATVVCSVDQGTPAYGSCTTATSHTAAPLADGSYVFRVRATDAAGNEAVATRSFSVDRAAPSVSVDSGPSGPTNDVTPSFEFTAEPGASVECSVDEGTPVYGPCTGAASHTAATLADGSYVFRVRATDAAGNEAVATRSFVVDATAPAVGGIDGPSGPTSDTTPSFGFTAEPGATVACSIDQGTPAYGPCTTATSHATGAPLGEGSYVFRVRATDAAGNQASASQSFVVDSAVPSLSIGSGPSGPTRSTTPSFAFTAEAGTTVECSIDQGTPAYGSCSGAASHAPVAPLADGEYAFRVRATDAAGNEAVVTRSFSVDTAVPSVSVDSGPSGPTSDATPSFEFTAEAGATVQCSVDQGTPSYGPCTTAVSHAARALAEGSYVFRVRATDAAGNQASDSQAFSVDSEAPSLTIDSGPAGATNDATPSFGFTAEAGATVACSVDQGTPAYAPCSGGATTHAVSTALAEGRYVFRVRATDGAGNDAPFSREFMVDTTLPSLSIGFGPSATTSDSTPLFGFSAEAGTTVQCSIDQGAPAYGPCASATTHAAGAPLADGAYVFRVRATDAAGNQTSVTRAFTVDTVPDAPPPADPGTIPTPTPPAPPPVTPAPEPQLMSPFPLVRISGTLTSAGARIRLLTVRASPGTLVRVTVSPACGGKRRSARGCRVLRAASTVGRRGVVGFRDLERAYRGGTVIVVRVWRPDRIGKYTRFTIVRGKAPRRVDQCLVPGAARGSRCPSG